MTRIPKRAEWYLAYIVEEIRVQGNRRNVVWINTVLVRAKTREEAYTKAKKLGKQGNISYKNTGGRKVTCRFRGIKRLSYVYERLQDGAELGFEEHVGVSEKQIRRWIKTKRKLFMPVRHTGPDLASGDIMREFFEEMKRRKR
jgi:hypothetical protein